jgi:phosphatidylinositol alpha-1,6-mannosyltransferase
VTLAGEGRDGSFTTTTARRLTFGAELATLQAAGRCDWLFFTHLSLATVQRHVPRLVRKPYVVFLHDVEAWLPLGRTRTGVLRAATLRFANSHFTAHRVEAANPAGGPVIPCPLALPDERPRPADPRAADRWHLGSAAVLIVGRMMQSERYKGHDELLAAWPLVTARVPDAQLVCVGEGDDVERLQQTAHALGVAASVTFTGFTTEAERDALYARAAVFAMPSAREGFGLVYLEAMAARLPCIGSTSDAAGEVIEDGRSGFLVDRTRRESLAARLVQLLTDPPLRERMGEAGRERLRTHFSYETFARRLRGHLDGPRDSTGWRPAVEAGRV